VLAPSSLLLLLLTLQKMQKASRVAAASDSIPCNYPSSCNGMLVSWVKDADGFNLNLISFLYAVVSSSPKKATIVSFRLSQQLICYILHSFNWPPPSSGCMWPTFLSSPPHSTEDVVNHRPCKPEVNCIFYSMTEASV